MGQPTRPAYNPGMAAPRWSIHKFALLFALALLARGVPAADSGPVSLRGFTNDLGQVIEADSPRGATTLMVFGYTSCPDVCPLTLVAVHQALAQLAKRGLSCDVAFVTVDPDRDTVPRLHDYVGAFDAKIRAYRGEEALLDRLTRSMKVRYWREKLYPDAPDYFMSHTPTLFLLSAQGRIMKRIEHSPDTIKLRAGIIDAIVSVNGGSAR